MKRPFLLRAALLFACAATVALSTPTSTAADDDDDTQSYIKRGFQISPVPLNLRGKSRALVGLGSYIVNTGACNDCHTFPSFFQGMIRLRVSPNKSTRLFF